MKLQSKKTTPTILATVALVVAFWLGLQAQEKETSRVEKSLTVTGTTNALNQARIYMEQGSSRVSIHRPFMSQDTNQWKVEATFYK